MENSKRCKILVYHPEFYIAEVFLLVDITIHVKRQTAWTSLIFPSVFFYLMQPKLGREKRIAKFLINFITSALVL